MQIASNWFYVGYHQQTFTFRIGPPIKDGNWLFFQVKRRDRELYSQRMEDRLRVGNVSIKANFGFVLVFLVFLWLVMGTLP
jgi:hypothetical protein